MKIKGWQLILRLFLSALSVLVWSADIVAQGSYPRMELVPSVVRPGESILVALYRIGGCLGLPESYELTISGNQITIVHTVQPGPIPLGSCVEVFDNIPGLSEGSFHLEWVEVISGSPQRFVLATLDFAVFAPFPAISVVPSNPTENDTLFADFNYSCPGPVSRDGKSVSVMGASISVTVTLTCGGFPSEYLTDSIEIAKLPSGDYSIALLAVVRTDPSFPYKAAEQWAYNSFHVNAPPPTRVEVSEFVHRGLGHYFISGNAAEVEELTGNPQLGWEKTEQSFEAIVSAGLPDGLLPVCRFYGSVSPGPNSHFFTADPLECSALMRLESSTPDSLPRWNLETLSAFHVAVPVAGVCPTSNPVRVRRFYNNRAVQNDSNHRYVVSEAIALQMRALGWIDEGIVICGG